MEKRQWYYCDTCKVYTKSSDLVCINCNNPIDMELNKPGTLVATPFNTSELETKLQSQDKWYQKLYQKLFPLRWIRKNYPKKHPWEKSGWKVSRFYKLDLDKIKITMHDPKTCKICLKKEGLNKK